MSSRFRISSSFRSFTSLASLLFGAAILAPAAAGCSSAPDDEKVGATDEALAESSYVSDSVLATLNQWPSMKGKTWNVTHDNLFTGNWLINTPLQPLWGQDVSTIVAPAACTTNCDPDFALQLCNTQSDCTGGGTCTPVLASVKSPGATPTKMCTGHSDGFVDEIYNVVTSAQKFVDVTSLLPADGRFQAGLRNAITLLSTRANPPEVRIITGDYPVEGVVNTTTQIKAFTRDVKSSSPIRVAVGAFRSSDVPPSWNHAKIVAADGKVAIVGGHNQWSAQYLDKEPVNDLSMEVHGSAAADAHRFANILWNYTCNNMTWVTWSTWSVWANQFENGSITSHCPAPYALTTPEGPSTGTVISVGRLGTGIQTDGNQADAARLALIRAAKTTIRIAQQDIGPVTVTNTSIPTGSWPDDVIGELANSLARNVDVYIVVSDLGAGAGGLGPSVAQYSNGWSPTDVANHFKTYMTSNAGYPTGTALTSLLCAKLHIAPIRYSAQSATWPSGNSFAQHSKTIEVDSQAFYIGSQNIYPAGLQEYGYIVDDSRAASQWLTGYWANLWGQSKVGAVTGTEATTCALQ